MRKLIFLFGLACALSLPVFAAETDNKVREMANETYQAADNEVGEMSLSAMAAATLKDFIIEFFGI